MGDLIAVITIGASKRRKAEMKRKSLVMAATMFIMAFVSPSVAAEPVPPCPWPIPVIENAAPGTPDSIRSLLGEWVGKCVLESKDFRQVRMIVWRIQGNRAQVYHGWGKAEGSSSEPEGGWARIEAEVVTADTVQLKWQKKTGWPAIITLKGDKLERVDSGEGTWYTTTLQKVK